MERWQRRSLKTIGLLVVLVILAAIVYHYVLVVVEGRSPTLFQSSQVVVEIFTGTGFGSDSPWQSPLANVLVIALDLSTFLLLFIVLPYVFQPILEERLSPSPPEKISLSDHVVIAGRYTAGTDRLIEEFEARGVGYVLLTPDRESAIELDEAGISVIYGDPAAAEALKRAEVTAANAVIVDTPDESAASCVLAVRELAEAPRVIVQVEDRSLKSALEYAGADVVLTPRRLVARRLADRLLSQFKPGISDVLSLSAEFAIVEMTVPEESPLCDRTLADADLTGESGVTVLGVWEDGQFVPSPSPEAMICEHDSLVLAGPENRLQELEVQTGPRLSTGESVVIAGAGEVGSLLRERLESAGIPCTVIDRVDLEGIDVHGDVTEEETLESADLDSAAAYAVAIGSDAEAVLSILLARNLEEDLDIIARVNDSDTQSKARRAGANYVLSLPDISGRLIAMNVLREDLLSVDRQVQIVRLDAEQFGGRSLDKTPLLEVDAVLVAVEREGSLLTEIEPGFPIQFGDKLLLAGSDEAVDELDEYLA